MAHARTPKIQHMDLNLVNVYPNFDSTDPYLVDDSLEDENAFKIPLCSAILSARQVDLTTQQP